MSGNKPIIAVTMGDPAGVGPEVTAKAIVDKDVLARTRPFVVGSAAALDVALQQSGSKAKTRVAHAFEDLSWDNGAVAVLDLENLDYASIQPGKLSAQAGKASVEWILKAGELAAAGKIQAISTAPINKEACRMAGYKDIGHMEIFQRQTNSTHVATMLVAEQLRVVHLTTHKSLRHAPDFVTKDNVFANIKLTHDHFVRWGFPKPRIGVAALNPHASDGGLLGDEEAKHIRPAIEQALAQGIDAAGPVPSDTLFPLAIGGKYDVVLAMYHDQGHIPTKVHNWALSIAINLGLPFIRTSVDHGTAFDIAGKNIADHKSMLEALRVAALLASESRLT
ncbi:MAG: 4-hydroxythreonine-4-phosphate dehydrogenase PdxA [Chloroflexi bacterium]|nr:4-hydroxythreonine-4-phosphate dehydrogenase PdxA [Chloroflexota bacterium]